MAQLQSGLTKMRLILKKNQAQLGFTLIELMITIVVLALLLFIGSSLTSAWIDRNQVNNGLSSLKNAVSQAKSAALRNTNDQPTEHPAASVCFDRQNNKVNIVRAAQFTTNACLVSADSTPTQNYVLQSFPLAQGITLTANSGNFECLAFNSSGVLVEATGLAGACSNQTNLKIDIEKNDEKAQIQVN